MKTITFDIPDSTYRTLSEMGRHRGQTATDLAKGATMTTAVNFGRPNVTLVAELHAEGLTVSEIAKTMGTTNLYVRDKLAALRLSANPRRRDA